MDISAQVSLYPLRKTEIKNSILQAIDIFRSHGLRVEVGPMSTLLVGEEEALFSALQETFQTASRSGDVVMVTTFSNTCPENERSALGQEAQEVDKKDMISFQPIGYVENQLDEATSGEVMRAGESRIILDAEFTLGLRGLKAGEKLLVLWYPHQVDDFDLLQHPRGDQGRSKRGLFSLRTPRRPNPICATVVNLISIEGNELLVHGLDAYNDTPVLDIKPA